MLITTCPWTLLCSRVTSHHIVAYVPCTSSSRRLLVHFYQAKNTEMDIFNVKFYNAMRFEKLTMREPPRPASFSRAAFSGWPGPEPSSSLPLTRFRTHQRMVPPHPAAPRSACQQRRWCLCRQRTDDLSSRWRCGTDWKAINNMAWVSHESRNIVTQEKSHAKEESRKVTVMWMKSML